MKQLAAKVSLFFFKNTNQLQFNSTFYKVSDQDQFRFKQYLTNVAIFEMPQHFILKLVLLCLVLILYRFTVKRNKILLQFLDPLLSIVPFHTPWKAQKIFSGVIKREHREEISEQVYQKENREFPICFPSKKPR